MRFPLPTADEILHPWWHHPNAKYVGHHRGTYEFWPKSEPGTPGKPLPYGIKSVRLTPYIDANGVRLSDRPYFTIQGHIVTTASRWQRIKRWFGIGAWAD